MRALRQTRDRADFSQIAPVDLSRQQPLLASHQGLQGGSLPTPHCAAARRARWGLRVVTAHLHKAGPPRPVFLPPHTCCHTARSCPSLAGAGGGVVVDVVLQRACSLYAPCTGQAIEALQVQKKAAHGRPGVRPGFSGGAQCRPLQPLTRCWAVCRDGSQCAVWPPSIRNVCPVANVAIGEHR